MIGKILMACGLTAVALAASAHADIVVLKNGNRLEGSVVAQDDESVTIRVGNAELSVLRENIEEVIEQTTPRELYHKMLEALDENDPVGHYQIALYCNKENLDDEAVEMLRRALELKPGYREAEAKLKEIIEPAAGRLFERARQLAAEGKAAEARESYRLLVESYPESHLAADAQAAIAELHFAQQNYAQAMEQWKDIIKEDRRNTRAYLGVVRICERVGRFDKAVEILDAVLRYEKDEGIRKQCRNKKAAISGIIQAQKAVEQAPQAPENYIRLAEGFEKLGRTRAAVRWMEAAVEKGSGDLGVVEKLARYYDKDLRVVKALRYWSRLKDLAPGPDLAGEADARIARLTLLNLIPEYLRSDCAERREEILAKLEDAHLDFALAESIVRKWLEFPEADQKGIVTRSVQLADGSSASYVLFVPESYDPSRRRPLIIALHGAGGTGDQYVLTWVREAQRRGWLVLAPTGDQRTGWNAAAGREILLRTLRDVREHFNVDPNRVFIDGTSMGAQGAWQYALQEPDLFAGLVSRSGAVRPLTQLLLPNARNMSVYIVHGLKDTMVPLDNIKGVRRALIRLGCNVELRLDPKSGHSTFVAETPRIMEWMSARSRDPYPKEVRFALRTLDRPRCYWLKAELLSDEVFDPSRKIDVPVVGEERLSGEMLENYFLATARAGMAILNGKIAGNTVRVATKHVIGYSVLLSDRMLDLDEPLEVYTNGKLSFHGKAQRSLPFMLEWARRYRDPEMVFSAHVRIVVRDEK